VLKLVVWKLFPKIQLSRRPSQKVKVLKLLNFQEVIDEVGVESQTFPEGKGVETSILDPHSGRG